VLQSNAFLLNAQSRIGLPVWPFHSPLAHQVGEVGYPVEHDVDRRSDVFAVHDDGWPLQRAQGRVQDRRFSVTLDLLAPKHGLDA
jgi:hypothetical protein